MHAAAIEEDEGKNYERKFVNRGRGLKSAEIQVREIKSQMKLHVHLTQNSCVGIKNGYGYDDEM